MGQLRQRSVLVAIDRLFRAGTAAGLSDAQLLERFATRHGEAAEAAFAALMERHGPMVLRVCRRVLNDPHDAQDAFQATFLILVRRPGAVRHRASLAGWLYGVALRVAAHSRAASARRRVVEQAAGSRFGARCVPDEGRHEVWEEVDRLPERYRVAIVLCYLEGLTHEQAAARLGWPVGTVRSRLARARERLRGRLVKRGLASGSAVLAGLVSSADANTLPLSLVEPTIKAAMLVAAHDAAEAGLVSASAAALTHGVLRTMLFVKLKWTALALMTAGTIAAGTGVYGYQAPRPLPRPAPVVADDSVTPATEAVVSDAAENSRQEQKRTADRLGVDPLSANLLADKIAALTRTARGRQEIGEFRQAAVAVQMIEKLASDWGGLLRQVDLDAGPAMTKPRATPAPASETDRRLAEVEQKLERVLRTLEVQSRPRPGRPNPTEASPSLEPIPSVATHAGEPYQQPQGPHPTASGPATTAQTPKGETDRRLSEVERELERVLRTLEDESRPRPALANPSYPRATPNPRDFSPHGPPPALANPTEPRPNKAMPLFKKKKAPVYTYPKRTDGEAEVEDSPEPAAPPLPPARPRPPEPPKPPTSPDGEN